MSGIARELGDAVVMRIRSAAGFRAPADEAPVAANEDAAPLARPDPSVLSVNTEVKGSIATTDELYIQGKLEGDVRATSIIVCQGGVVRGDITADNITVYGSVAGNLYGGHVRLCAGAVVDGEIRHLTLGIDTGANFEGSIKRVAAESVAAE